MLQPTVPNWVALANVPMQSGQRVSVNPKRHKGGDGTRAEMAQGRRWHNPRKEIEAVERSIRRKVSALASSPAVSFIATAVAVAFASWAPLLLD
jgi:hypothetical protein